MKACDHLNEFLMALNKAQHPFIIKAMSKPGIERKYLNIIKAMWDKSMTND